MNSTILQALDQQLLDAGFTKQGAGFIAPESWDDHTKKEMLTFYGLTALSRIWSRKNAWVIYIWYLESAK